MGAIKTKQEWLDTSREARRWALDEQEKKPSGPAKRILDTHIKESNRSTIARYFAGSQSTYRMSARYGFQNTEAANKVENKSLEEIKELYKTKKPEKIAQAKEAETLIRYYNHKMRGSTMIEALFYDPLFGLDGKVKWKGIAGLVAGAGIGLGLFSYGSASWVVKALLVGGMAVAGAAGLDFAGKLYNNFLGEKEGGSKNQPGKTQDKNPINQEHSQEKPETLTDVDKAKREAASIREQFAQKDQIEPQSNSVKAGEQNQENIANLQKDSSKFEVADIGNQASDLVANIAQNAPKEQEGMQGIT